MNIKQLKSGNARELFQLSVGDPSRKEVGVRHIYFPPACFPACSPAATRCHTFTHRSFIATHGAALSAGAAPLSAHDRIVPQLARFPNADITRRWPGMICCWAASAGMADSTTLFPPPGAVINYRLLPPTTLHHSLAPLSTTTFSGFTNLPLTTFTSHLPIPPIATLLSLER